MSVKPQRPPSPQADEALDDAADVPWGPPEPRGDDEIPTVLYDVPAEELRQDFSPAYLSVEVGPSAGQVLELFQGTVVIGRASVADLRIQHPSISRRHTEVHRVGERFFVEDLGSQNGTFVNKVRVSGRKEIRPMDALSLGHALVRLRGPANLADRQRSGPLARNTDTAVVARAELSAAAKRPSGLAIAVLAGAAGFGLAGALALALTLSRSEETASTASPSIAATSPTPSATPTPAAPSDLETDAVAKALDPQPPPSVLAAPRPAPGRPTRPTRDAPTRLPSPPRSAVPEREPATPGQALQLYERGDAEGALKVARLAQAKELAARLSAFLDAYAAGKRARAARDLQAALSSFQRALVLDEELSSGWGKYGAELRRELAWLHVTSGKQSETKGDAEAAKKAYEAALLDDPGNEPATAGLTRLAGRTIKSPDEAFDEAPARTVAEPKRTDTQRIDEAFGE